MNKVDKINKIRVLECIRQGQVGGGESHVIDLVTTLNKDLYEPIVLSFTDGQMVRTLKEAGIKTYVIHTERGFDFGVWKQVLQLMKNEKIELLHAHGTRAFSNTFWAANKLNIPIVYTVHGWSFHQDQKPVIRRIREYIEKLLISNANTTITVSYSNQKDGVDRFNMPRSTVIYYGINLERFNPNKKFIDIRKEWGVPENKTLVGFLVRMTIQKDPFTMVKAIKKVMDETPDVLFLMIGEGELKDDTLELAKELGVIPSIIFKDFRQDVPEILNAIDIYCLPSLWEGLPIGLIESMAMKKAIVASPVDGTKEAIVNNESGILVPEGDSTAIANAILKLHKDKNLREKYGENAYQFAIKQFDAHRMAWEVEKIYNKILSTSKVNKFVKFKLKIKSLIPFTLAKRIRGFYQKVSSVFYKGSKYYCPFCKNSFRKLRSSGHDIPFLQDIKIIGSGHRKNSLCPRCFSIDRERLVYLFLKEKHEEIFSKKLKLLHISPEASLKSFFNSLTNIDYIIGRNYRDNYYYRNERIQMNLFNLHYPDNEFDIIVCNHVLEHVKDDELAMSELNRILKPGGFAILQVPYSNSIDETIDDEFLILPEHKEKYFPKFEKVRIYAKDYPEKLKQAGFTVERFNPANEKTEIDISKYALNPEEDLFVGYK
ncbi:MAG: glycosyltransferase [Bacteroidales bacterium]|nr:glycosyltransferase [Bacteroidales bacterium]